MTRDRSKRNASPGSLSFMGIYSSIGGRVLSHYEIGPLVGKGGMGHVYKGHDIRLDRPVAIKVLPHWARGDRRARQRFLKEAQASSQFTHPHIVTVYEFAEEHGVDLMVMEYVVGRTLDEIVPSRGLPVSRALVLAVQIADALGAAHAAGILHRDLKPSNVMVTADDSVKLLDFGLARSFSIGKLTHVPARKSDQPGTRLYMSPEQLRGYESDPRSEVFSFGMILYQMLAGKHPFGDGANAELLRAIRAGSPSTLPRKVPPAVAVLVYRCLEKTRAKRFQSMKDVWGELQQCGRFDGTRGVARPPRITESKDVDQGQIRLLTRQISYRNLAKSRKALGELTQLLNHDVTNAGRKAAISALKDLILTVDPAPNGVPDVVREVRKLTLDVLKRAAQENLAPHFSEGELERLDLFGMNFGGGQMAETSFKRCFLVETSFERCNLNKVTFAGAWIRNVKFAGADLTDADFTETDWFNAIGLTEAQLRSARQGSLLPCPPDTQALRRYLQVRYGQAFESWATSVQEELKAAWADYLRPGGLRDAVARWRQISH